MKFFIVFVKLSTILIYLLSMHAQAFERKFECRTKNFGRKCIVTHNRVKAELICSDIQTNLPCKSEREMTRCSDHIDFITIDFYESFEFSHFVSWLYISQYAGNTFMYDCELVESDYWNG